MPKATKNPNAKTKPVQKSKPIDVNQYINNDQALSVRKAKEILRDLDDIVASAQVFIECYHITRKKLNEIYSPTKPKSVLTDRQIAILWANRLKTINRGIMKAQQEREKGLR